MTGGATCIGARCIVRGGSNRGASVRGTGAGTSVDLGTGAGVGAERITGAEVMLRGAANGTTGAGGCLRDGEMLLLRIGSASMPGDLRSPGLRNVPCKAGGGGANVVAAGDTGTPTTDCAPLGAATEGVIARWPDITSDGTSVTACGKVA